MQGHIQAGAGKAVIRYPEHFFPYRGFRGRRLIGIHDDIFARVLLLKQETQTCLLISLELGDITDEWAEEISEKTGIPADHIWLTVTHNHTAPYANSTWGEYVPDEEKTEPFCSCCIEAIMQAYKQAAEGLQPAAVRYGEGKAYVNVNRDAKYTGNQPGFTAPYVSAKNVHGYTDHTVSVTEFAGEDGRVIAFLVGYAVHSSVLFKQFWGDEGGTLVSGDLSGAAMRYVEERSDAIAIHLLGAAGNQNARFNRVEMIPDKDGNLIETDRGDAGYALVEAMAQEWGSEVLRTAEKSAPIELDRIMAERKTIVAPTKEKFEGGPPMSLPKDYEWKIDGEAEMTLTMLHFGDLTLFGIPGELVAEAGSDIKKTLLECGLRHVLVVTQCNGSVSYMSNEDGYAKKTFEATQSHFAAGIAGLIEKGAAALAGQMV